MLAYFLLPEREVTMRTPQRVKQTMYYSTWHEGQPIYATDEAGNIVYDEMPDGSLIPRQLGETPEGYDEPVEFQNSITGDLAEAELQAYGSEAKGMAKMTYPKGKYPFAVGVVIWKDSEVKRKEDGTVDETSADYRVVGVQTTGRHFSKALLAEVV